MDSDAYDDDDDNDNGSVSSIIRLALGFKKYDSA